GNEFFLLNARAPESKVFIWLHGGEIHSIEAFEMKRNDKGREVPKRHEKHCPERSEPRIIHYFRE
ncbi:MAG: hypothetical protein IJI39_07360, partial [Clostridia bacterium]|nr:hypothetical protein [Clostridia bacterium]